MAETKGRQEKLAEWKKSIISSRRVVGEVEGIELVINRSPLDRRSVSEIISSIHDGRMQKSLFSTVGFVIVLGVLLVAKPVWGIIPLDNTCTFGSDYVQLVGFACIADEERVRNPSWDGRWTTQGRYQIAAFHLINKNMNAKGIDIGGTTYCSNFTVRSNQGPRMAEFDGHSKTISCLSWP